jgi:hypothetical protein
LAATTISWKSNAMVIQMNNPLYDPQFLAGLAIARGQPADQAYTQAALMQQQNQDNQMKQAEYERQQYFQQALPQILGQIGSLPTVEAKLEALTSNGASLKDALLLLQSMGTGEAMQPSQRALTPAEIMQSAKRVEATRQQGDAAQQKLRLFQELEDAYTEYDEDVGKKFGASESGGILAKITPDVAQNLYLSEKQLAAKDKIEKVTETLANIMAIETGNPTDDARRSARSSIPGLEKKPEARKSFLGKLKPETAAKALKGTFEETWRAQHNGDLSGAEEVFQKFIKNNINNILDKKGELKDEAIEAIKSLATTGEVKTNKIESYIGKYTQKEIEDAIRKAEQRG